MEPEVKELIRGWLELLATTNTTDPTPEEVRDYLSNAGFDSEAIERTMQTVRTLDSDRLERQASEPEAEPADTPGDGQATVPYGLEMDDEARSRHVDFGDSTSREAFTSFDDMTDSEKGLYKDFTRLIKNKLNDDQRQMLAREINRFKNHDTN